LTSSFLAIKMKQKQSIRKYRWGMLSFFYRMVMFRFLWKIHQMTKTCWKM